MRHLYHVVVWDLIGQSFYPHSKCKSGVEITDSTVSKRAKTVQMPSIVEDAGQRCQDEREVGTALLCLE